MESVWITPGQALAAAEAGERVLVFATRLNLLKLARFGTVAQALAGAGPVVTVCPEPFQREGATWLRIPAEAGYGQSEYLPANRPMAPLRARPPD